MYSYNKLSWQQSELFHLLKKLGESITHSQSRNIFPLLCSWAGCGATWVTALHPWYNHVHCTESPLCISAGWIPVCSFEEQTFWKDTGGHNRWEEMSVLLLGSLWDVTRIRNHCHFTICRRVWVAQWYLTLCNTVDCSPPGSSVHGVFQARILEWVAIPFSRRSFWHRDWTLISSIGRQILYHLVPGKPNLLAKLLKCRV